MLVFDLESDGLLEELSIIHCINLIDRRTGKAYAFNRGKYKDGSFAPHDGSLEDGLKMLEEADCIAGQNIISFDCPAIQKLYPKWKPRGKVFDTKVCSSVIWTNMFDVDMRLLSTGKLPAAFRTNGLIGRHSLEAWGYRLGEYKGDFKPGDYLDEEGEKHTWKTIGFTQEMDTYGRQDPVVTLKLVEKIESKMYSQECLDLEHRVAQIIFKQHERGFAFDMNRAEALSGTLLKRHAEIAAELTLQFDPWYAPEVAKGTAVFTPKKDNKKQGYTEGAPFSRVKCVVFNPASRDHIADRLAKVRGWKPSVFTDGGKPQIDETVLGALPWPEAKILSEYLMVEKRLGMVATGKQAWITKAVRTGIYGMPNPKNEYRIHGTVNSNGAVTGRMTHNHPNVGQTPAVRKGKGDVILLGTEGGYGAECRELFEAGPGLLLVGCDAEGLELRILAHFMAKYDNGAYADAVVNGKKELGTDVHTVNRNAIGLNVRDNAKTFVYAMIYGAGDYKLGTIVYDDFNEDTRSLFNATYKTKAKRASALKALGTNRRARLMSNLPALGKLVDAVKAAVKARGYLMGLDGRQLHVRSEHAALNTLLQSGGALVMKKALVLLDDALELSVRSTSAVAAFVANIHDEVQLEVSKENAEQVGALAADCIRLAGEHFRLRCPLSGSYAVGANWKETH